MPASFDGGVKAYLRGLAQIVFADNIVSGILVLSGLALMSPWLAAGAAAGAALGTILGRFFAFFTVSQWRDGLTGYNTGIIGILSAGLLASSGAPLILVPLAMVACAACEMILARLLTPARLPILSAPAACAALVMSLVFAGAGDWLWVDPPASPLGRYGMLAGGACVLAAMVVYSPMAASQAVLLSALSALAYERFGGVHPLDAAGLWAFTVAPASYSVHAAFFGGSPRGSVLGAIAACVGSAVWLGWGAAGIDAWIPPLLLPFIVGAWTAFLIDRWSKRSAVLDPRFWRLFGSVALALRRGATVTALVGAGAGREAEPALPHAGPSSAAFRASAGHRRAIWAACEDARSRRADNCAGNIAMPRPLAALQGGGWLHCVFTQSISGVLRRAGASATVELKGNVDGTACLDCGIPQNWPPAELWRRFDLRCPDCGGLLWPALLPADEDLPKSLKLRLRRALADCDVLLVTDDVTADAASRAVLKAARARGTTVYFLGDPRAACDRRRGDRAVTGDPAAVLSALAVVLRKTAKLIPSASGGLPRTAIPNGSR